MTPTLLIQKICVLKSLLHQQQATVLLNWCADSGFCLAKHETWHGVCVGEHCVLDHVGQKRGDLRLETGLVLS